MKDYDDISSQLKQRIVSTFFFKVKIKVIKEKRQEIKRLSRRSDIHQILMVSEIDNDADNKFLTENLKLDEQEQDVVTNPESAKANQPKQDSLISKEIYFEKKLDQLEDKLAKIHDVNSKMKD